MFKVLIVDHTTGRPLENFKPADLKELPKDLVDFIHRLPKGDKLKPLERDTINISTHKMPETYISATRIPEERNVELTLPMNKQSDSYACLTDNKSLLKETGYFPITVTGLKNAIRSIAESKKAFESINK